MRTTIFLIALIGLCTGLLRPKDHLENQNKMMQFIEMIEVSAMRDIQNFTETGYRSELFNQLAASLPYDVEMARNEVTDYPPEKAIIGCTACRLYLAQLISQRRNGGTQEEMENSAFNVCRLLTSFSEDLCRGVIRINVEPLLYIIDSRPTLTATQICGMILQGECGTLDNIFSFSINPSPGPPVTGPKTVAVPRSSDDLKIIHITDLHFDENYLVGGIANCDNPICCRRNDGPASSPNDAAGRWGDYRWCNNPWETIENLFRRIKSAHPDADAIYHTGDIIDHGVWETSRPGNIRIMDRIYNAMREIFGNIPVYSCLGNHEAHPTNVFAPDYMTRPSLSIQWLYDYAADTWSRHGWISGQQITTVRQNGMYTALIRPGFRLISMNNNDCYIYNWWILYSRDHISQNLQWLNSVLLQAEQAGERVHILKHLPSGGGSCFKFWSREYRRIIDRFHNIIGAQFNGHSHRDEFEVFYDSATAQHAINVAWNGGSAVTYANVNPNYHLYHVDRTHYQVTESESFIFSMSEANANAAQGPRWFRQYAFTETWNIPRISPATLDELAFTLSRNRNLLRRYFEYKVKAGDPMMAAGCDDDCLRGHVCSIVVNEHDDNRRCNQVLAVFGTVA